MIKNISVLLVSMGVIFSGCSHKEAKSILSNSSRTPASSQDLVTWTQQISKEITNPLIFNDQTCSTYIKQVTHFLYHLPADHLVPKNQSEIDELKKIGPQIIDTVFQVRLNLHEKVKEYTQQNNLNSECLKNIRNGLQYARFTEEYLLEWLYNQKVYTHKTTPILQNSQPSTWTNPQFKDFKLETGDVMLIRGKSFVSAMIARISDQEGNFSHLAIVGENSKGEKVVVETLIHTGVIITPLEKWVQSPDARVALYRYPDKTIATKAGRFIHDHAKSFIDKGKTIRYDFAMDDKDYSSLFCSEVIKLAYDKATDGALILPKYRSTVEKFKNKPFPKSMGITAETLFSPYDIEVDPNFDFIAEYRHQPLLRQVRMQDAVLQSIYEWMVDKDYTFKKRLEHTAKSYLAKTIRQFGLVKETMPTYMPVNTIETTLQFEGVATKLEQNIYALEEEFYKKHNMLPSFQDLMKMNEDFRKKDCLKYQKMQSPIYAMSGANRSSASEFHWFYRSKNNSCE